MPIYEYECNSCHAHVEVVQKISEAPLKKCEACGADSLEKLISQTSFQLKGGGWYKDLYSSSSKSTKGTETKTESSSTKTESTSTKTESSSTKTESTSSTTTPAKKSDSAAA